MAAESRGQALVDLGEVLLRLGKEEEGHKARDEGSRILADREAHAKLLEAYLQDLLAETETVRLSDLAVQAGHQILSVPLDEIYVPLTMIEERLRAIPSFPREGESGGALEVMAPTLWKLLTGHEVKESRPLSVQELLGTPRAVILGDPGSGKSTLLRYIARLLARSVLETPQPEGAPSLPENLRGLVPILIPVVRLAARLTHEGHPDLQGFIRNDLSKLPGVGATLIRYLQEREAFLLIDGLDEVPASLRLPVRDTIEDYLLSHREIRCLATSRIVGYEGARLGIGFAHVRLQDLDDKGIQRFALRWYQTIKDIVGVHEDPRVRAERLWEAISANPGIRRIAGNPLLLTIIGLVHCRGSRLPQKRLEVYEAATKTLLENWLARRPFVRLRSEEILRILPRIAFEIHKDVPAGLVSHDWLKERFTAHLAEVRITEEAEVSPEVDSLLETISQHSGLLLERGWAEDGQRLFGFLHLTFQEYLAALWLFEQWISSSMGVQRGRGKGGKRPENPIYPFLLSPRWQEVILLAAGRASDTSQATGTRFLQDVLEYKDRYERILNRAILVAGRILADGSRVERGVAQTVCKDVIDSWFRIEPVFRRWSPTCEAIRHVLGFLGQSDYVAIIRESLLSRLKYRDANIREAAADGLSKVGDPRALQALAARLADREWSARRAAAVAVGHLKDTRSLELLLARLGDRDLIVREAAAWALGVLRDPRAFEPLLARLADENGHVRRAAASALGDLGDPRALEALVARLADENGDVRWAAALGLGSLKDPRALEPLLARLGDREWSARRAAAEALGGIGNESVVERLEEIFYPPGAKRPRLRQSRGKGAVDLEAAREALFLALMNVEGRSH